MFSEDYAVRTALSSAERAKDPNLTDNDLAELSRSDEVKVRAAVGERVETPLTVLVRLASDPAPAVRAAVGRNPRRDIPLEVRSQLVQDKSAEVLHALIRCETLPEEILQKLARSWNRDVALAAKVAQKARKKSAAVPAVGQVGLASS